MRTRPLYRPTDTEAAYNEWGANCGPGAMAAVAGVELAALRPHLREWKGFTTPSLALFTLRSMGINCDYGKPHEWPPVGLVCVQFGGPWLAKGTHWAEPYKRSHYIAVAGDAVYDVNCNGWVSRVDWEREIIPWLGQDHKNWDGTWYPRSCIIITE